MTALKHFFVTVDAETNVLADGVRVIARLRDELERTVNTTIPLVWFVRFQRTWREYVDNSSPSYFAAPLTQGFDGFALAAPQFKELRDGGDEIGWHYHAYNYVHRDDLDHATKLAILEADLEVCAGALQARHPDFHITSFRFGWFFVPDYTLYATLQKVGITIDASVRLDSRVTVGPFKTKYLPPITQSPARVGGISCFPFSQTLLVHDWNVVAHDLGWSRRDAAGAAAHQAWWRDSIVSAAAELKREGGVFSTYAGFPCHELPELSLG